MIYQKFAVSTVTAAVLIAVAACSPTRNGTLTPSPADYEAYDTGRSTSASESGAVAYPPVLLEKSEFSADLEQAVVSPAAPSAERHRLPASPSISGQIVSADKVPKFEAEDREKYADVPANPIVVTANQPTSTFSIDVDSGSYANVRRFLNTGALPPKNAVRVEEMINYFSYDYERPEITDVPFSITTELAPTPWNDNTHLLHVGLQGYEIDPAERPDANLVFLIDVSGSMESPNKLMLVKPAMKMLVNQLTADDTVSIVVYAGDSGAALEPTAGSEKRAINRAIDSLKAGGSTNGRAGIELAYDMAAENFKEDAVNRVILVTDGDFNVGMSNIDRLKDLIEDKRESGIALTTLGFGQGNYNDHLMEQLADVGNGAYAYIDNLNEARKVLVDEVSSTLLTIAKDVKIQVEFNPAVVAEYRLIGYENRHLANEDFSNDNVDAGDIGAGHTVTALYEVALVGNGGERNTPLRYGDSQTVTVNTDEVAELRLRYKDPQGDTSKLIKQQINKNEIIDTVDGSSDTFRFSAAVAALGQQLSNDKYLGNFGATDILALASGAKGEDTFGYRQEFENLTKLLDTLDVQPERVDVGQLQGEPRG